MTDIGSIAVDQITGVKPRVIEKAAVGFQEGERCDSILLFVRPWSAADALEAFHIEEHAADVKLLAVANEDIRHDRAIHFAVGFEIGLDTVAP